MKARVLAILLTSIIAGCSYDQVIKSRQDFYYNLKDQTAEIALLNGTSFDARCIALVNDSLKFLSLDNNKSWQVPVRDIQFVRTTNHTSGAVRGFVLGSLSAGTTMIVLLRLNPVPPGDDDDHVLGRVLIPIAVTVLTGTCCAVVGGINGDRFYYQLQEDSTATRSHQSVAP